MSRDLQRRLAQLEGRRNEGIRFTVSDRPMSDEEWQAHRDGSYVSLEGPEVLGPIMTEAEWLASAGAAGAV